MVPETLSQLAQTLKSKKDDSLMEGQTLSPTDGMFEAGKAEAFDQAHEIVMKMVQKEEALQLNEVAPSVESTLPVAAVLQSLEVNSWSSVEQLVQRTKLDRDDIAEALEHLAAEGRVKRDEVSSPGAILWGN